MSLSSHQHSKKDDRWFTPLNILRKLGSFDLDPCTSIHRPWDTAFTHYCVENTDGLRTFWGFPDLNRVWLNPPFSNKEPWLYKMAEHNNGVVLLAARTETRLFFQYVWGKARAICFVKGRLHFYNRFCERAKFNCGAPIVLLAYGQNNIEPVLNCGLGFSIKL